MQRKKGGETVVMKWKKDTQGKKKEATERKKRQRDQVLANHQKQAGINGVMEQGGVEKARWYVIRH